MYSTIKYYQSSTGEISASFEKRTDLGKPITKTDATRYLMHKHKIRSVEALKMLSDIVTASIK
jgi:hypothetical protein